VLNNNRSAIGNFFNTDYWTSSEYSSSSAMSKFIGYGYLDVHPKSNAQRVRCIRSNEVVQQPAVLLIAVQNTGDCTVAGSQPVGTKCTDAAHLDQVYAGYLNFLHYYTLPYDQGQACWNNCGGTGVGYIDTGAANISHGRSVTAPNNYDILTTSTDIGAPYKASNLCAALNAGSGTYGATDWYLPALNEMLLLKTNAQQIGGLGGYYWTSTESTYNGVHYVGVGGTNGVQLKIYAFKVRCIRHD